MTTTHINNASSYSAQRRSAPAAHTHAQERAPQVTKFHMSHAPKEADVVFESL